MAAPITHIVLAEKIFTKFFGDKNKKDLYLGTSFPDIRYLGIIEREKTHFHDLKIQELQTLPAFEAGLKLHSLVDEVRETFVQAQGIYQLAPDSPYTTLAIKFFEDQILYHKVKNWPEIAAYFSEASQAELAFGLKNADILVWHQFLRSYFTNGPTEQGVRDFVKTVSRPAVMAEEMIKINRAMADNQQIIKIINDLYERFEELIG